MLMQLVGPEKRSTCFFFVPPLSALHNIKIGENICAAVFILKICPAWGAFQSTIECNSASQETRHFLITGAFRILTLVSRRR